MATDEGNSGSTAATGGAVAAIGGAAAAIGEPVPSPSVQIPYSTSSSQPLPVS